MLGRLDLYMQKNGFRTFPCTIDTNSKWTKYLNIRPQTINPLKKREGGCDTALGKNFLDVIPRAQATKKNKF